MKCIKMYFKKRRLLKKYERTDEKKVNDLHLMRLMKDDEEFKSYFLSEIHIELRCYRRIKNLK